MDLGIEIIGVSRDLGPSQRVFGEQVGAKNRFLSDVDMEVINLYGAGRQGRRGGAASANRYYFLVDEQGKLIWKNTTGSLIPADKLLTDFSELVGSN